MTVPERSDIAVNADLIVNRGEPLSVTVRVEDFGRGACLTLVTDADTEWRLAFGPDGGAFIAGALAVKVGVKFDEGGCS